MSSSTTVLPSFSFAEDVVNQYVSALRPEDSEPTAHTAVYEYVKQADLNELEENRDSCVALVRYLASHAVVNLLRSRPGIQDFWFGVLKDAKSA